MTKENKAILNELFKATQRLKYPSFPEHYHHDYKHSDNSTNGLTRCVVDFLNFSNHFAERINSTGRFIAGKTIDGVNGKFTTQGKFIKGSGRNGTSDISAKIKLPNHKFAIPVSIEIKWKKDRQSSDQKKYEQDMNNVGAVYVIVKTFDGFMDWYNEFITNN
jgi:hypothetical protein